MIRAKNHCSIMIPKARGVRKPLFCISTPNVKEDMNVSLPYVGQAGHRLFFFSRSHLHPLSRKGLTDKTYPAMDSSVTGESDGVSCISVEDCIQRLRPFI